MGGGAGLVVLDLLAPRKFGSGKLVGPSFIETRHVNGKMQTYEGVDEIT